MKKYLFVSAIVLSALIVFICKTNKKSRVSLISYEEMTMIVGGCGCDDYCTPCDMCPHGGCCSTFGSMLRAYQLNGPVADANDCWYPGDAGDVMSCQTATFYFSGCSGFREYVVGYGDSC